MRREAPLSVFEKLQAPFLIKFTMDFATEKSLTIDGRQRHDLKSIDFGVDQVKWMQDYASIAKHNHSRSMQVHIKFFPDEHPQSWGPCSVVPRPWPWEDVETARMESAKNDLVLTYQHFWAKKSWTLLAEEERARVAQHIHTYF